MWQTIAATESTPEESMRLVVMLAALVLGAALALPAHAAESASTDLGTLDKDAVARVVKAPGYSPYAGRKFPTRPFFGDTHLHTALSLDARAFGNTLGPEEAYRFARGEEVVSATGQPAKLSRPLDFLVVADHAEALGTMVEVAKGSPAVMSDPSCKRWHDMMAEGGQTGVRAAIEIIQALSAGKVPKALLDPQLGRSIWENYTAIGEK